MCYTCASKVSVTMLVFEAKLEGTKQQYERLNEAIRTARFVPTVVSDTGWTIKELVSTS